MKGNLETMVNAWFHDWKEYALDNFALCSEWLSHYVENSDYEFLQDFFEPDEIERNSVEELREVALNWIAENADDIINFEDYR